MRSKYRLDTRKALEAVVYVARHIHDRHGILKALYIADRKHIREYGRPIYAEGYVRMEYGPVESYAYDLIKIAAGENDSPDEDSIKQSIEIRGKKHVAARRDADRRRFSTSDIECLDAAIKECRSLSFNSRTNLTHDAAYRAGPVGSWMTVDDIAQQAPDAEALLDYLHNG